MDFKNKRHQIAFTEAVKKMNRADQTLMSAVYLCTADQKLWAKASRHIGFSQIDFDNIKLTDSTENAYTLLGCAKDLTLGTQHITISDMADSELISTKLFRLICNAMVICRDGLGDIDLDRMEQSTRNPVSRLMKRNRLRD